MSSKVVSERFNGKRAVLHRIHMGNFILKTGACVLRDPNHVPVAETLPSCPAIP